MNSRGHLRWGRPCLVHGPATTVTAPARETVPPVPDGTVVITANRSSLPCGHSGFQRRAQGPEMIAIVIVEVYEPDDALAGTFTHQPTGLAAVLPPMTTAPSPEAAAAL